MTVFSRRKQGQLGGLSDRTSSIILVIFSLIILQGAPSRILKSMGFFKIYLFLIGG